MAGASGNTINYASVYEKLLDREYKLQSVTAILETAEMLYKFAEKPAATIYTKSVAFDGMADYNRSTGYVAGDVDETWTPHTFAYDRGRRYLLDAVDVKDAMIEVGVKLTEIMRTKIAPEIDVIRFHKLCSLINSGSPNVSADLTYDNAISSIDTAVAALDDAEVSQDRVLFVSNSMYTKMKQSGEFFNARVSSENNGIINREIMMFDNMPLIRVPSTRFYTAYTFYDGTTGGQEAGGFVQSGGKAMNFMIISISAVIAVLKHMAIKLINPELNQSSDGYMLFYRFVTDCFMPLNKRTGGYVHSVA